jgi:RNA polymerase sigma factor (sigma-70 family)
MTTMAKRVATKQAQMDINSLYQRTLSGSSVDENALFSALSARFRLIVRHRVSDRDDVEDIVQESLAVIHAEYRGLAIHSSFAGWAMTVLKHRLLAYFDRRRADSARSSTLDEDTVGSVHLDTRSFNALKQRLLSCLRKIGCANVRYARIINLHHQGYGTEEICGRLALSTTNFYSILSRARVMLEKCLEERSQND